MAWFGPVDLARWYADADGDGFGDPDAWVEACNPPADHVADNTDCYDTDPGVNPDGTEICNDVDDDCDGPVDEDPVDAPTWYADTDADGFGDPEATLDACDPPLGYVADSTDCDDTDATVNADGTEVCNDVDDDCDGPVDEGGTVGAMSEPEGFVWAVRGGAGVATWTCIAGREAYEELVVPEFGAPSSFGLSRLGAWGEAVSEVGFQLGPGAVVVTNTSGVLLLGGEVIPVTEFGWGFRAAF